MSSDLSIRRPARPAAAALRLKGPEAPGSAPRAHRTAGGPAATPPRRPTGTPSGPVAGRAPLPATLHRRLLAWYRPQARDLPWRRSRDPYRVWLSEVMLQQTQVATARPYYERFLACFPTLASLARAQPDEVLAAWAGLGYYRRARHLHEAARRVVREHGGRVPDEPEVFGRLPGVGRYTAAAVLSICFDRRMAALDGNVARVLSRLYALPAAIRDPRGARRLWALAGTLVPMLRPGDWNQALMELGATVCTARAPACGRCPLRSACVARRLGRVAEFPPLVSRRPPERTRRAVALILRGGRMLVERRDGPLLTGLWEPPGVRLEDGAAPGPALRSALARLGLRVKLAPTGRTVRHTITHRAIAAEIWHGTLAGAPARRVTLRWVDPACPSVPLTGLAKKLAAGPPHPPAERRPRAHDRCPG